jgi:pimeloyl-ACP methyl ester carboxylesterase
MDDAGVEAQPVRGAYDVDGPDDAPAIVFVHGTRLCRTAWAPQVRRLRDGYRVIAVDLPGHGILADEPFTIERARGRVVEAIREAGAGRAVLVGLSLGGYVAMDVAASHPELVRGLVLSGASAEPDGPLAIPIGWWAWSLEHLHHRGIDAVLAWFLRTRYPPDIAEPVVAGGFWTRGGAEALRSLQRERFAPRLAAYPGPTLILNGEYDLPFRLGAPAFARAARSPVRVRLAGATHLANFDRPEAFSFAVRRFADGLDDRTGPAASEGPPAPRW